MSIYLTPDKKCVWNGVTVNEYFITKHNPNKISLPSKRTKQLIGVTLHNTEWINVNSATTPAEQYTRSTFNGNMRNVRVHFYVDDKGTWQNLPLDCQSWHAGHTGKADRNGSEKGNQQTISIECIMDGSKNSYSSKSRDNAARLAAYLLYINGFTANDLYTHNYWENIRNGKTGSIDHLNKTNDGYKNCPVYIRPQWDDFKKLVDDYIVKLGGKSVYTSNNSSASNIDNKFPYGVRIIDKTGLNVRKKAGMENPVVCIVKYGEVYTIVNEICVNNSVWGELKSGAGFINVGKKYVEKIK